MHDQVLRNMQINNNDILDLSSIYLWWCHNAGTPVMMLKGQYADIQADAMVASVVGMQPPSLTSLNLLCLLRYGALILR
jgi:hypothetical protein